MEDKLQAEQVQLFIHSLNEEAKTDLSSYEKKPTMLCSRLDHLYDIGMKAKKNKNLKHAYIYFKRWIIVANFLRKKAGLDEKTENQFFSKQKVTFLFIV